MTQRKYNLTLGELVDRLAIVMLKSVFISAHSAEYTKEQALIEHDIDLILKSSRKRLGAAEIRAILVLMLANRFIWENESKARAGGPEQDRLLKLTHSINGVRNAAKNKLAAPFGERKDYKVDCFAAELVKDFGNWQVFK